MKQNLKKLSLSIIVTSIFSIGLYYIITIYDKTGLTITRINQNIQYLIFLFLSIIISLSIYNNKDKKSKLILAIVILINFLYIIFLFGKLNIGLNNTQGLFLIGFLILSLISNYINNRFGHIITSFSIVGILGIIGFSIIPMYEVGPDIQGFENNFHNKLLITSKVNIKPSQARIKIDNKTLNILNGISSYDLKINKSGSKLLFISDKKYLNTFGYILFPNLDIIQIYPQSAINITKTNKKYQIEIIQGIIKHYSIQTGENNKYYTFTGNSISLGIMSQESIKYINKYYEEQLKQYITKQIGIDMSQNTIITKISQNILEILAKIFPKEFSDNLDNLKQFKKYFDIQDNTKNIEGFDNTKIKQGILQNIKNAFSKTQILN